MHKIKQFADMTGVTVRMLRHYDKIGLLVPEYIHPSTGYRYYGANNMHTMQQILFFKALDFSLNEIKDIINDESLDRNAILSMQKNLLNLQKDRLKKMVHFIDDLLNQGVTQMNQNMKNALDSTQFDQQKMAYAKEARQKWGQTSIYQQSQKKQAQYSPKKIKQLQLQQQSIYQNIARLMHLDASHSNVQDLIHQARIFINDHWYECSMKQFAALGQLYVDDDRFKQNIDQHGTGLAEFIKEGIDYYCRSVIAQD